MDRFERYLGNKMNLVVGGLKGKSEEETQKGHRFPALSSPYGLALQAKASYNSYQHFNSDECTMCKVKSA